MRKHTYSSGVAQITWKICTWMLLALKSALLSLLPHFVVPQNRMDDLPVSNLIRMGGGLSLVSLNHYVGLGGLLKTNIQQ